MCSLLWLVLRGTDDALVDQILRYGNDNFNNTGLYFSDGGTDIEELLNPGQKVKLSLTACLKYQDPDPRSSNRAIALSLQFDISYRTHAGPQGYFTTSAHGDLVIFRDSGNSILHSKKSCSVAIGSVITDASFTKKDRKNGNILNRLFKWRRPPSLEDVPQDHRLDGLGKWDLLVSWFAQYPKSAITYNSESLPTRVLDLTQEGQVRLVEGPINSYVALSHRWGASQHLTLTTRTLDKIKLGIPVDLLPMTFRDAVSVARRLGVFCLWIDALCIVQEDRDDWLRESKKMGDIFTNAACVIAVHSAADDSQGFLDKALSKRAAIEFKGSEDSGHLWVCRRSNLELDVTNSTLSKRGWVLQERFLALHTLHFTSQGVFSETTDGVMSEDGKLKPTSLPSAGATFFGPSALPQLRGILTGSVQGFQTQFVPLEWLTLVEMYTNCDLTREEDKLLAISGMARRIHSRTGKIWCAGLWSNQIAQGLLWLPAHGLSYPTHPRAPSWSWAAWDGPIQYAGDIKDNSFEPRTMFVSVQEIYPSSGSTEKVWLDGLGTLHIRAKMISLENVVLANESIEIGPGPDRRGYLTDNNRDLPRLDLKHYLTVCPLRGRRYMNKRLLVRDDRLPLCGWVALDDPHFVQTHSSDIDSHILQDCWFAVIGIHRVYSGGLIYLGIFLCPVTNSSEDTLEYRRIGCGQLSHSFLSGENLEHESMKLDELGLSTLSDNATLLIPSDFKKVSAIIIQ